MPTENDLHLYENITLTHICKRWDNQEWLAIMDIQYAERRQMKAKYKIQHIKLNKWATQIRPNLRVNTCLLHGSAIVASYKTHCMLLIQMYNTYALTPLTVPYLVVFIMYNLCPWKCSTYHNIFCSHYDNVIHLSAFSLVIIWQYQTKQHFNENY